MFDALAQKTNWSIYSLGNIIRINTDSWININDADTYQILGVRSWGEGVVIKRSIVGAELTMKRYQVSSSEQLMWCKVDTKNGAFGVTKGEHIGALASSNMCLADIDTKRCLPALLQLFFRLPAVYKGLTAVSLGTTNRQYLKPQELLTTVRLHLPSIEEQRSLVARIEELAAKIAEARGLRSQTGEEIKALGVSSAKTIFAELAQAGVQPLRELVTMRGGGTPSKANPFFWEGSIPWICPKDMKSREINDSIDHISEEATCNSSAKMLEPGAVLVVVRGMILAHTVPSAVLRVPATINQDMKALISNENLVSEYLCKVLWALNDEILALVEKSTHDTRKLETPKLLNFKIPVPPLSEQRRIVAYLDNLQAKVDALKQMQAETAAELNALLPSILDKAFKGKL